MSVNRGEEPSRAYLGQDFFFEEIIYVYNNGGGKFTFCLISLFVNFLALTDMMEALLLYKATMIESV
jgi:hypothetical protein